LIVGYRIVRIFFFNKLLDLQLNDPRGNLFAVFVHHAFGEKAAQLDPVVALASE